MYLGYCTVGREVSPPPYALLRYGSRGSVCGVSDALQRKISRERSYLSCYTDPSASAYLRAKLSVLLYTVHRPKSPIAQ